MSDPTTVANSIMDRAIALGTTMASNTQTAASTAITAAMGYSVLSAPSVGTDIGVVEPNVYIPTGAIGVDSALYNSTYDKIINDLGTKFGGFFTSYFPINATLLAQADAWLSNALLNGGSGVKASVEDAIWQRDRDRLTRAALTAEQEATASWAAKGYPMPTGAAYAAVQQIRRDRDIKIAESSQARAIESWKMEYENMKFVISTVYDSRVKAIQAAGDYIRTLALGPQIASQLAVAAINAQSNLISAASTFYNARIKVAEMKLEKDRTNAGMTLTAGSKNMDGWLSSIHTQAQTAATVAGTYGSMAAAALNAVNSTAQIVVNN
jgi:hypothetical protein